MNNIFKIIIMVILLLFSTAAQSNVVEQRSHNNVGQLIVRYHNNSDSYFSCYFRDQYNYYTFVLPPRASSMWFLPWGYYQWECR